MFRFFLALITLCYCQTALALDTEKLEPVFKVFKTLWNFELFKVGDRSITISNVTIAMMFFIVGVILSRLISKKLRNIVMKRMKLDQGPAATIESLIFYVFIFFFTLFALNVSNIPLTVFTIIGSAVALGVGFGSQNVLRNFISGLIILVERPIQVGDVIEVGSTCGSVKRIGTRSTWVCTYDNIDIVVPNSDFLEKSVINWTLGDDRVRSKVHVGVAYGSPTEKVRDILIEVAGQHESILKNPAPSVLFNDFGDNSLAFTLYFWMRINSLLQVKRVESDLRFKIDEEFRKEHITIAFPQRDVHFDTSKPISIKLEGS